MTILRHVGGTFARHSVGRMHRSRIGIVLIDHAAQHDESLAFWSGVTGVTPTQEADEPYSAQSLGLRADRAHSP